MLNVLIGGKVSEADAKARGQDLVQAVLFDLFETLVTERERMMMPVAADRLDMDAKTFGAELRARRHRRFTGAFVDYASVLTEICLAKGLPVDAELISRIEEQRKGQYEQILTRIETDVMKMLRDIRLMGLRTCLVSNAAPEETTGWDASPLSGVMDEVVFSCRIGAMKPDAAIYATACDRLGVRPEDCAYVGDGGSDELPAAASLGMTTYCASWFVDRFPRTYQDQHNRRWNTDFTKLHAPSDLIEAIRSRKSQE